MTDDPRSVVPEVGGVNDRLLPWGRVQDIAGISRTTAWRMQRAGDFPKPVQISPGRVGWWESELTAWKSGRGSGAVVATRAPPSKPRLPGMPRRMPGRAEPAPREAEPAALPVKPPAIETGPVADPSPPVKPRRGQRAASPNQIDFGF